MSNTSTDEARYAWEVMKHWLASSPDGKLVLDAYAKDPKAAAGALDSWLRSHADQAPPQLATYVQGGQVGKLVNIAHAGVVSFDASGASWFINSRGLARVLLVLGTALALAGFGFFGYPIVKAASSFNSGLSEAEQRCHELFPQPGFDLSKCLQTANSQFGGADFEVAPWLPLGAGLMFAGMVVSFIGMSLIRSR